MGTWGYGNFENDGAADFIWEVEDSGQKALKKALELVVDFDVEEPIENDLCEEALVAAEYVAASLGNPSKDCPEDVFGWIKKKKFSHFKLGLFGKKLDPVPLAQQALKRIMLHSELRDCWEETSDFNTWLKVLHDLEKRLANA